MNKVFIKFRGGIEGIVSQEEALKITEVFARYQETRKDELLVLSGGRRVRISNLEDMQDWKEPVQQTMPIQEAMETSAAEEADPGIRTLKEAQIKIFQHNKMCLAKGKMEDFIWYYIENGKIMKSTKEVVSKRMKEREKKDLLNRPGVHHVTEVNGQLSIGLNH